MKKLLLLIVLAVSANCFAIRVKSDALLWKMAIDLSDGVIQASDTISQELVDYAKQFGKPFLEYQSEDVYVDSFNEFYNKVLG